MRKIELFLAGLALLGLTFKLLLLSGGTAILGLTLSGLGILYYPFGFFYFNSIKINKIFKKTSYKDVSVLRGIGTFGAGITFSILTTGILFKLADLQGSGVMLSVGITTGLILLIVTTIRYFAVKGQFFKMMLRRTLIWVTLGITLYLIPGINLVKIFHRDNPEYIEAYQKSIENPDDRELLIKADEARRKKNNK